jgi:hypothetical protein
MTSREMKPTLHTCLHRRNEACTRLKAGVFPQVAWHPRTHQRVDPLDANCRASVNGDRLRRQVILVGLESAVVGPGPKERATGIEPA